MKERNPHYEWLRAIAMLLVIMVHIPVKPFAGNAWFSNAFESVLLVCNYLFFMLSGQLNLSKRFETREDIVRFYKSRLIGVLVPFAVGTAVLVGWNLAASGAPVTVRSALGALARAFLSEQAGTHLWFMYYLMGFLLSTPFLARMLQGLDDAMLKVLMGVALGWNFVSVYLAEDLGIHFGFTGWILGVWTIAYVAGYACPRLVNDRNRRWLYAAGLAGLAVTVLGRTLIPGHYLYANDLSPAYTLFGMAAYVFLIRHPKTIPNAVQKTARVLARESFLVYILHVRVIARITEPYIPYAYHAPVTFVTHTLATLAASFALAFLLRWAVVQPVQKLLRRVLADAREGGKA